MNPRAPRLLALDTTGQRLVVALADGDRVLGLDEEGGARASQRLLPAVQDVMERAGLALGALDAIAFARGPGAFTGLRTAASAAQGLAFGLGIPVLPLDSLMIVAEDARLQAPGVLIEGARVEVAMDARMDEIYAACYRLSGDGFSGDRFDIDRLSGDPLDGAAWHDEHAASLLQPEALALRWRREPPQAVAGSALDVFGTRLAPPAHAKVMPSMRHAVDALAAVARLAFRAGRMVDPQEAQPLYVRDKVAFTTPEREAMRRAATAVKAPQ